MWIDPVTNGEFDVAIGACVKSIDGENICLIDDDNQVSLTLAYLALAYMYLSLPYFTWLKG